MTFANERKPPLNEVVDENYNLQEEFGWFLDGIQRYISENPEEVLEHYGVLGMKWGVRRSQRELDRAAGRVPLKGLGPDSITRKTATGETLTLTKKPPTAIQKGLARASKRYTPSYNNKAALNITNKAGEKIGDAVVQKKGSDELNLIWLGIEKASRGQGYATAAMKVAAEYGEQQGFTRLTLEVPRFSPDARHIYEKLGFRVTKEPSALERKLDRTWGGLTEMEYDFKKVKHQSFEEVLEHYGVKGMKWGVRRSQAQLDRAAGRVRKGATNTKNKVVKTARDYQAYRSKIQGEAILDDFLNLNTVPRMKLNALRVVEGSVILAGAAAARKVNTEIQVAQLKRKMKDL